MGRRYGQHFLRDPHWIARIVAAADLGPSDRVLEIGPGQGALTLPMADKVKEVLAYEIDTDLKPLQHPNLTIRHEDFLKTDLPEGPWKLVANLPYYITTPILEKVVPHPDKFQGMWLMMQHEVAKRIVSPASREAGSLTYFVAHAWEPRYLFKIPPGAFAPPPEVHSAVVEFLPKAIPSKRPKRLERLVRSAFHQRRKTLRRSLEFLPPEAFTQAGIDPQRRPETLTLQEFERLEEAWWNLENT